ncbi:MBL fold metallo-hydrolase [Candidatus Magnetomonas plexicatena]|uniref:MBL fold metallo-hydrolase n=1 Tax=Candidatus Magnetomonas plexicatena TaxID=2552947 RepID=UPI001C740690|nr:MBL fold metallo-hydrolase [Nitrospirales bacterium LBB_01]
MKIRFCGVRGSIPTPGKETVRYGGNTSCIELTGKEGTILIFDSGTGIRTIGERFAPRSPLTIHLLLSHTHWDHIHGFPFFLPAYIPKNVINIYGPPHFDKSLREIMAQQMVYSYFPVNSDELSATINYRDLKEETLQAGEFTIKSKLMNHPVTCFGYRVTEGDKSIVYTGDNEPYYNFMANSVVDDSERQEIELIVKEQNARTVEFAKGVDVLICDAQYSDTEYLTRVGWGHSSTLHALDLAIKADVKHLVIFHHEPSRSDDKMDELLQYTIDKYNELQHAGLKITAAVEGEEIDL